MPDVPMLRDYCGLAPENVWTLEPFFRLVLDFDRAVVPA